jgi:hypothetical protein
MRYAMLEVLPKTFPPADIIRIDMAIPECFRDTLNLFDPNLVHLVVASSYFVCSGVHLPE